MNLIFLVFPGSGKGTVAKALPRFKQISTGDLLRSERNSGSELGKHISSLIDHGKFVSDQIAMTLIENNTVSNGEYIFDGFPRTIEQAHMLSNLIGTANNVAVLFEVLDQNALINRIINRRSCAKCGEIYNLITKPPQVENTCDLCGNNPLTHRDDDKIEKLTTRMDLFTLHSPAILDYYKSLGKLIVVNGDQESHLVVEEFKKKVGT